MGFYENDEDAFLPLRDVVFKQLREEILYGKLKPGERLMEIHLASRFGVSRTPVREAIRMLEQEGLVTLRPARGAVVASISAESVQDVLEVRRAMDVLCASLACKRITETQLESLKEACAKFEEAVKAPEKDLTHIAACDVALHDIIIDATANRRLKQLVNNLSEQMYRYRFEYIKDRSGH